MSQRLNLMSPEVCANPYPVYAELRRNAPVCQVDPAGMWAVSRYDDVVAVLKDPRRFSSTAYRVRHRPEWLERDPLGDQILTAMDPPEHLGRRNLISPDFGPGALARLEPWVRSLAGELAERVVRGEEVDFVAEFALALPGGVLCHLLGLDPSLAARFKRWSDDMALILGVHTPEQIPRLRATLQETRHYFGELIEARRREPGDDLLTHLLRVELDGRALTDEEVMSFLWLLMLAGVETTVNLLGNTMVALAAHPREAERVMRAPGLIPALIEEVLRYESPAQLVFRLATGDAELPGGRIPAGGMMMVLLASAGRDERRFEEPDTFRLDRQDRGNLPFGHGNHFCLGAALARMEARLALEALFSRIRGFTPAWGANPWEGSSLNARGPRILPLRFERA